MKINIYQIIFIQLVQKIVCNIQAETHIAQISLENPYNNTLKISASNHTLSIRVNWGDVENLEQHNQSLELIINTKTTKNPTNLYQIPYLCLNNKTSTTISKPQRSADLQFTSIECDNYGYQTNSGIQRININSNYYGETQFYVSFFDLSSIQNDDYRIPVGNIELDQNNELTDDNFWQIDIEIGLYKKLTKPIYCFKNGVYIRSTSICLCEKGFVGQYCEFQIKAINSNINKDKLIIQPYEYALFQFDYDDFYNITLHSNNTCIYNFFNINEDDSDTSLYQKFISGLNQKRQKLSKQIKVNLVYTSTFKSINSIYFLFQNKNIEPLNIDMIIMEKSFLKQLSDNIFHYTLIIAQFYLGGFTFINLLVFFVKKMRTFSRNNDTNTQDNGQSVTQNSQFNNRTNNRIGYQNIIELN